MIYLALLSGLQDDLPLGFYDTAEEAETVVKLALTDPRNSPELKRILELSSRDISITVAGSIVTYNSFGLPTEWVSLNLEGVDLGEAV